MRFFKYNSNENIGRIWSLFSHMAEAQINQTLILRGMSMLVVKMTRYEDYKREIKNSS